jgi:hypothetical protein
MKLGTKSKASPPPVRLTGTQLAESVERWRIFRILYPLYHEVARQFDLGPSCSYLDAPVDRSETEVTRSVEEWFAAVDDRMDAWHLRQIVQTTALGSEEALRGLILRLLGKPSRSALDRDKIDFLLVQYLDQRAPRTFEGDRFEMDDVAAVLEPVLGEASTLAPAWLAPLEDAIAQLQQCGSLRDLLQRRIIERVRGLKEKAGPMYFGSATMIAFTRFNYLMRRAFFRLLYDDLHALRSGVQELEQRGVASINATAAQLSAQEPLARLRAICTGWKQPFRAPYAAGQALRQLIELRAAVEAALQSTTSFPNPGSAGPRSSAPPKSREKQP